jgi:hypothetical protein
MGSVGQVGLVVVLVALFLSGFLLQVGASRLMSSYQRPQGIVDVPTFDAALRQVSPEVTNIIRMDGIFVQDGIVDSNEKAMAMSIAERFPNPTEYVLQNQLDKPTTVSENGASKNFNRRLQTEDLVIYFNNQPISQISEVLIVSEFGVKMASAFLNYVPHGSFGIYLFDSREDRNKVSEYEVHYPNIYVWYSHGEMSLKNFLIHELTHMVEIDYYGRHWCEGTQWSWINEGIADYVGWEHFWNTGFVDLRQHYPAVNLTQVVSCDSWEKYRRTENSMVYPEAQSVIEYLVETYGHEKVVEILQNFKTGLSPDDALKKFIGVGMTGLEAEWRGWLADVFVDSDNDGLNNSREKYYKTNPNVPDTDGDGLLDGAEVKLGTDPTNSDTNGDGLLDGAEVRIAVDGYMRDWNALKIGPSVVDPQGDNKGGVQGTDIKSVYAALDDKYIYLAYHLYDRINKQQRVQFCFGIDTNGDGTWEYQPGFDLYGRAWLWNLTQGTDYSNMTKVSTLYEGTVDANEAVEFRMNLFAVGYPKSMWIEPYDVIEHNGQYMAADGTNRFHINTVSNKLPQTTNPLVPDSTATTIRSTTPTESATIALTTLTTTASTIPTTSTEVFTTQPFAVAGIVLVITAAVGVLFLRRRRK